MSKQRAGVMKDDSAARELFGRAYDAIPKSVFAVACWYLCDAAADEGVGQGAELIRFRKELEALSGQVIDPAQAKRALLALSKVAV